MVFNFTELDGGVTASYSGSVRPAVYADVVFSPMVNGLFNPSAASFVSYTSENFSLFVSYGPAFELDWPLSSFGTGGERSGPPSGDPFGFYNGKIVVPTYDDEGDGFGIEFSGSLRFGRVSFNTLGLSPGESYVGTLYTGDTVTVNIVGANVSPIPEVGSSFVLGALICLSAFGRLRRC